MLKLVLIVLVRDQKRLLSAWHGVEENVAIPSGQKLLANMARLTLLVQL